MNDIFSLQTKIIQTLAALRMISTSCSEWERLALQPADQSEHLSR